MNMHTPNLWLDWESSRPVIAAAVVREGYPSLTAYATSHPGADLIAIAGLLEIPGVHDGHLQLRLWEEASERGDLRRCACDLLIRLLCAALRARKTSGGTRASHVEYAFDEWREQLPQNYRHVVHPIRSALASVEPPDDWYPVSDDSILASLFERHWPEEALGDRYHMRFDRAGHLTIETAGEHALDAHTRAR